MFTPKSIDTVGSKSEGAQFEQHGVASIPKTDCFILFQLGRMSNIVLLHSQILTAAFYFNLEE
jgi:hypothetical protein